MTRPARPTRPRLVLFLGMLLAACTGGSAERPAPVRVLALEGVTVIDGTGAQPRPEMTILLRDGRIADLYPSGTRALPAGARTLPVRGRYVIPGLIDAHVHLATFDRGEIMPVLLRSSLLGGVTSVRDMGGNTVEVARLARAAGADSLLSPRIFFSAVVAGPEWFRSYDPERLAYWSGGFPVGRAPGVTRLDSLSQIPGIVAGAARIGAAGIKVYSDVRPAWLDSLAKAAHRRGLRVWTHAVVPPTRPDELVAAGADVISHADQLIWTVAPDPATLGDREVRRGLLRSVAPRAAPLRTLLDEMRRRGVILEPTLLVMQMNARTPRAPLDTLPAWAVAVTREAAARGVSLLAGTDALGRETPNIHSELQLLVRQVGLTPLDAIRSATETGARALGAQDSLGTIAVGKVADLVVLRSDPSRDIRNTQTIEFVIQRGRAHRRTEPWVAPALAEPAATP